MCLSMPIIECTYIPKFKIYLTSRLAILQLNTFSLSQLHFAFQCLTVHQIRPDERTSQALHSHTAQPKRYRVTECIPILYDFIHSIFRITSPLSDFMCILEFSVISSDCLSSLHINRQPVGKLSSPYLSSIRSLFICLFILQLQ